MFLFVCHIFLNTHTYFILMANKQKHKYGIGYNTRDQIKALAGSAKRRSAMFPSSNSLF